MDLLSFTASTTILIDAATSTVESLVKLRAFRETYNELLSTVEHYQ